MTSTDRETELERLREENGHLRSLLKAQAQKQAVFSATDRSVVTSSIIANREELEQQARLFDTVLSSIVDFAYTFDREGRFTYVNQALLDLWHLKLEEACGKSFRELNYPTELADRLQQQIETVFNTGQKIRDETSYTGADGTAGYYEYILVPVFGTGGQVEVVAGTTRDISLRYQEQTEREALVKALEVERERLSSLFLQAPAFIAILRGPEHIFEMATPPDYQLIGPERDIIGRSVREAVPEVASQNFIEILDEVYRSGKPYVGKNVRILLDIEPGKGLQERYIDFVYQPLVEADGSISGIFVHGVDLTERKCTEVALHASEERVRLATEAAGLGVWVWEPATDRALWENERMYAIYGLSSADKPLTSMQFLAEIVHPDDAEAFAQAMAAVVETGAPLYSQGRFCRTDGEIRWIEFTGSLQPVIRGEAARVVGTAADITDRKRAEQFLQEHTREIEALNSRLKRSMTETHHRVKNNLQLVFSLMELLEQENRDSIPVSELIRLKQNIQALSVIHEILTQESKDEGDAAFLSIKSVMKQFLPILQSTLGERRLIAEVAEITVSGKQATSLAIIANELISNATKHGKGNIELTLDALDNLATLEVCDDGPGFEAGFDPATVAHTGLELIENIARYDLRGEIVYENREEGGARITVVFPTQPPHSH